VRATVVVADAMLSVSAGWPIVALAVVGVAAMCWVLSSKTRTVRLVKIIHAIRRHRP